MPSLLTSRQVRAALLDLVFPDSCPGCGVRSLPPACQSCLRLLNLRPQLRPPDPLPVGLPVPWAITSYAGPVRALVVAHKEHGRLGLTRPLGAALARSVAWSAANATGRLPPAITLVPVPSTRSSVRRRGHDPTLRITRAASRWLRRQGVATAVAPLLTHSRRVQDQSALGHAARAANLSGALAVRQRALRQRSRAWPRTTAPVVVVDDVVTTGATLAEAVRALAAVGLEVTGTAAIAATARRRESRPPATDGTQ